MKFVLNKDRIIVEDSQNFNSGSINFYEAEIEYSEDWNDLNIAAILIKKDEQEGQSIAIINNKFYIDKQYKGTYSIGFVGYIIENETKTYQISTNLIDIYFDEGAGEVDAKNQEDVPTPSEWEVYLEQVQQFINNGNAIINQANNLDISNTGTIVTITKKDGTTSEINVKGDKGDNGNTPVKGVDYWTEQDKQEIEADIIQDDNLETKNNKVTSISSTSTDNQYPSAKCVYDIVGNIETLLGGI